MTAPNRYDELGPLTRPIIDRLINALASSPSTSADAARAAYRAAYDTYRLASDDDAMAALIALDTSLAAYGAAALALAAK